MFFAKKLLRETTEGTVYLVPQEGDDELDYFYLILVPHRQRADFERDIQTSFIDLNDYGRILHFGSGHPSPQRIEQLIEKAV